MARMKRSRRFLDKYGLHVAQFIRAKLTMPKSKNLDKVRGGKYRCRCTPFQYLGTEALAPSMVVTKSSCTSTMRILASSFVTHLRSGIGKFLLYITLSMMMKEVAFLIKLLASFSSVGRIPCSTYCAIRVIYDGVLSISSKSLLMFPLPRYLMGTTLRVSESIVLASLASEFAFAFCSRGTCWMELCLSWVHKSLALLNELRLQCIVSSKSLWSNHDESNTRTLLIGGSIYKEFIGMSSVLLSYSLKCVDLIFTNHGIVFFKANTFGNEVY
uniref:Uncharacterized protein n=1 Tax=Cannabis sativa TaxID=3483 RepID=A0A803NJ78_CANSA